MTLRVEPTIGGGSSPAATGWQTRYEVDFTALANAGPYANGVNVIGGVNWTMENAASGTWQVINGVGLQGSPQIACDLNNGFRTAPILTARLIDLDATLDWTSFAGIRLSIVYSTTNQNSNFKGAIMGLSRFGAGGVTDNRWEMTKFWSGALGWLARRNLAGGTAANTFATTSTTDDIMQIVLRDLNTAVHNTAVSVAGNFPASYETAIPRGFSQLTGTIIDPIYTVNSELGVLLAASDFNGSVNFLFTVTRLRIETIG